MLCKWYAILWKILWLRKVRVLLLHCFWAFLSRHMSLLVGLFRLLYWRVTNRVNFSPLFSAVSDLPFPPFLPFFFLLAVFSTVAGVSCITTSVFATGLLSIAANLVLLTLCFSDLATNAAPGNLTLFLDFGGQYFATYSRSCSNS